MLDKKYLGTLNRAPFTIELYEHEEDFKLYYQLFESITNAAGRKMPILLQEGVLEANLLRTQPLNQQSAKTFLNQVATLVLDAPQQADA